VQAERDLAGVNVSFTMMTKAHTCPLLKGSPAGGNQTTIFEVLKRKITISTLLHIKQYRAGGLVKMAVFSRKRQ
jgi:hypothetical protein